MNAVNGGHQAMKRPSLPRSADDAAKSKSFGSSGDPGVISFLIEHPMLATTHYKLGFNVRQSQFSARKERKPGYLPTVSTWKVRYSR
jgi:hypothetical protein